jgi:hypothetical protein
MFNPENMKKPITLLTLLFAVIGNHDSTAALISKYSFNEGSGSTISDSVRGVAGLGTISGTYSWGTGSNAVSGSSLRFYGADSVSGALAPMVTGVSTGFTLSAWAKFNSYTNWGSVVKNWGTGSGGAIHLGLDDNNPYFSSYIRTGGSVTGGAGNPITLGQWYNVLFTYDGTKQVFYLNGTFQGQFAATGALDTSNPRLGFGAKPSDTPGDFNSQIDGWIDEVAIYNTPLTAGEVSALYAAGGSDPSSVPEPGQVAASVLLLSGIGGYVFLKRRKAAQAATPAAA